MFQSRCGADKKEARRVVERGFSFPKGTHSFIHRQGLDMLAGVGPYGNISREIIFTDPTVKKKNNNRDHLLNIYYVAEIKNTCYKCLL